MPLPRVRPAPPRVGRQRYTIAGDAPLPSGALTSRSTFAYDGGGRGKGGKATLSVDGQKVAEGRVENTIANVFSFDEGADVGIDEDPPVTEASKAGAASRFTGKIDKVTIDVN